MDVRQDSSYSWLVMVAAFISDFLTGISTYGSVSVLVYVWGDLFEISTDVAAWAPAIMGSFFFLTGPLITVVIHAIGTWKTQLIGALLLLGSSIASGFATEYWHVIISYGIVEACGAAILNVCAADIVAVYFNKHKEVVYTGLLTFAAAGMAVAPALLEYLIKTLLYRNAMLIRSIFLLLATPAAFIYRGQCSRAKVTSALSDADRNTHVNAGYVEEDDSKREKINTDTQEKINTNMTGAADNSVKSKSERPAEEGKENHSALEQNGGRNGDIIHSVIKSHLHVLKDVVFILILLYFMIVTISENGFYALAVDISTAKGLLTLDQAALGVTLAGTSLLVGCVLVWILSRWELDRYALSIFSMLIMGLCFIFAAVSKSLPTLYTSFIAFGFIEGFYMNNILPWIADLSAEDSQYFTLRISYVFFMVGVGSLVGPVSAGYFVEATDASYGFYFLAAFPIIGALIILPVWLKAKLRSCRKDIEAP